jgi:hypothetical protein
MADSSIASGGITATRAFVVAHSDAVRLPP